MANRFGTLGEIQGVPRWDGVSNPAFQGSWLERLTVFSITGILAILTGAWFGLACFLIIDALLPLVGP